MPLPIDILPAFPASAPPATNPLFVTLSAFFDIDVINSFITATMFSLAVVVRFDKLPIFCSMFDTLDIVAIGEKFPQFTGTPNTPKRTET